MTTRIEKHSATQRIIGLTRDEVRQELLLVLWKAWHTWDPDQGSTLEQRFWAMWLDRKASLIRYALAEKRNRLGEVLLTVEDIQALEPLVFWDEYRGGIPPCPDRQPAARKVWNLLAGGATRQEVLDALGLSKRAYYNVVASWRNDEVRALLTT